MPDPSLKLAIAGILFLALFAGEHFAPYFKNRQQHVLHSIRNLTLATLNSAISVAIYLYVLMNICHWTLENKIGLLHYFGLTGITSFIVAFILIDAWQYLWHRLNHTVRFLWRFHQVHHADKDMDASTGLRFHTIEIVYSQMVRMLIIPLIGLQLEHLIVYEIILLPIILFHHSNINLSEKIDKLLRLIIVTPHIHRLHHSDIKSETDSNYASVFSIWDRIFKSYTMRPIEQQFNLGLGESFSEREWNRLTGMLKLPFQKISNQSN